MTIFDGIEEVGLPRGPVASLDFRRIAALPQRDWETADDLDVLTSVLSEMLRTPNGTMTLKVVQAAALREMHDLDGWFDMVGLHGLFGPIQVGGGKTLISLLAATVLGAKRPVLLVPAALRDQTLKYVLPAMRKHWRIHPDLRVVGYSELSLAKNAKMLERLRPDLIVADEVHMLKNLRSGRTRRVSRYMNANPMTTFVALSGTAEKHSIMDCWHIVQWCLKPKNTPLPTNYHEAKQWGAALDERVRPEDKTGPGALTQLCNPGENPREGFRRRLTRTPGVLATRADRLGVSLQVLRFDGVQAPPASVRQAMKYVAETWETPRGKVLEVAMHVAAVQRQLSCGFYYYYDPEPPAEWADAHKAWGRYVRDVLRYNRRGLDTPLQVWNDTKRRHPGRAEFVAWDRLRHTVKPKTAAEWVNPYMVDACAAWLREPGICWVEHPELGLAVAARAGVPYFGAGDSHIAEASGPVVASIGAHGQGKNLQQWNRNLVPLPPTSGDTWEQLLGRTHRMGQQSDTVTFEVGQTTDVLRKAMEQAFADARFLFDSLGNEQRLLYCDTTLRREQP